jgi:hypothetical protein
VVPLALYAAWYVGWGHTAHSYLSFDNVARSVPYVLDGLSSGLASLFGLTPAGFSTGGGLGWGRPLLLAALVAIAFRLRSRVPLSRWLWVSGAILLSFWFLTAINASVGRAPYASRYQYVTAVLILLVAADLAAGVVRPRRAVNVTGLVVAGLAVMGNFVVLHDEYVGWRDVTPTVRGGLTGLEVEADRADPGLVLDQDNSGFNYIGSVEAGPYLSAVDAFGSPAYSQSELAAAPERARVAADLVMGTVLDPMAEPAARPRSLGPCRTVLRGGGTPPVLTVPTGGGVFLAPAPGATATLRLRRYATESFPVSAGELTGPAVVSIPADRSSRPWQLRLDATGPVTACATRTD